MLATIPDYNERVRQGRELEKRIVDAWKKRLEAIGCKAEDPTRTEDKADKIDLWITNPKGRRLSVQVKVRESGDDLIFEIVKNVPLWDNGRDYDSKAELYFFVDRNGNGWLYWTKDIHDSVKLLREQAKADLDVDATRTRWDSDTYEMKVTVDHAHKNEKLIVFFHPAHFPIIQQFKQLL